MRYPTMMHLQRLGLLAASVLFLSACELIVDFDRSLIVDGSTDGEVASDGDTDGGPIPSDVGPDPDAASDGGSDAGTDSGSDAGPDSGSDAGSDAGPDAGSDAGPDAGPECTMPDQCDDGVACTLGDCVAMSCVHTPTDSECADDNICTVNTCDAVEDCQATSCSLAIATPAFPELSTVIRLATVDGGEGGLLAVAFDDAAGVPDMPLGATIVPAGAAIGLEIELSRPAVIGEVIHVQFFEDLGTVGVFDDGVDVAAEDAAMDDVIDSVTVALADGLPDHEVTIISADGTDYTFSGARPSSIAIDGPDPVMALIRGRRYRIRNTAAAGHPLEFVVAGATADMDTVQFAQGATTGAAEGEAAVDWDETDSEDIVFTASAEFEAVVDTYRCAIHPDDMRAAVTVIDAP